MKNSFVFIFLDGVGLGPKTQDNPFFKNTMAFVDKLIGGKIVKGHFHLDEQTLFRGIDAKMNTKGLPQSATGQTALFTGVNAPEVIGYHYPAFPNPPLRSILEKQNILKKIIQLNGTASFANAYSPEYFDLVKKGKRRHSATTWSVIYSGLPFRRIQELKEGRAVYWDFTNEHFKKADERGISMITAAEAGARLARLSAEYNLLLFETFLPDLIGHKQDHELASKFCSHFNDFMESLIRELPENHSVVVSSDHGNFEDLSVPTHTYNDALLLVHGPQARYFKDIDTIENVTDQIVECFRQE